MPLAKKLPKEYEGLVSRNSGEVQQEYELTYAAKEREEDIIADTMASPFQEVKFFGDRKKSEKEGWANFFYALRGGYGLKGCL